MNTLRAFGYFLVRFAQISQIIRLRSAKSAQNEHFTITSLKRFLKLNADKSAKSAGNPGFEL
ncbi:MAG: hypothetical protein DI535_23610 [Citrobacter freundii]|nr:MAG: hypothetical protein DI535_23610 [Citrobacter freundii]